MAIQETPVPVPGVKNLAVQELLEEEVVEVPWVLRQSATPALGDEDLDIGRYTSREFFDREVSQVWSKVWQFVCFEQEVAKVGDTLVYDIIDWSFLVTRTGPDEVKAFYNSCPHRGRQLRTHGAEAVCLPEFRCPFHALTWNIDGSLKEIPNSFSWDFDHVDAADLKLPEARVEVWDGLVFLNLDQDAEPLEVFLGEFTEHFARWPFKDRWKAAHVGKVLKSNWKVAAEAFMESYHVIATHPQSLVGGDGSNCEYDVYGGGEAHFNRMILAPPQPNPNVGYEITEQDILDDRFAIELASEGGLALPENPLKVAPGETARKVLANERRSQLQASGVDTSTITDMELTGQIQYWVFPNIFPWAGPLFYRFRPNGNDHESCLMEVMVIADLPPGADRPPAAKLHMLRDDEDFTCAPELGFAGPIFNQDMGNVPYIQKGLKASGRGGVTLAHYGDSRIRHFHHLLDRYLAG